MENRYFTELARRLGSDGVKTSATDGNRLEVLLRSRPVLCVSKNGNVIMLPDGRDNPEAGDLYHQTDALAGEVYEYVHAVENAPLLHAVDLRDKFHLLADFGGAVLAGRRREDGHGYQFVTWIWGYLEVIYEQHTKSIEKPAHLRTGHAQSRDNSILGIRSLIWISR